MNELPTQLLHLARELAASEAAIAHLEHDIGFPVPPGLREFYLASNGIEGRVGRAGYLQIWPVDEVSKINDAAGTSEFAPGLTLFGSDGGGESFGFLRRSGAYAFYSVDDSDFEIKEDGYLGATFESALRAITDRN